MNFSSTLWNAQKHRVLVVLCLANVEAAVVLCLEFSQTVYLQPLFSKGTAPFGISERQTDASKHSQDERTNTNRRDFCGSFGLLLPLKEKCSTYPFLLNTLSHALRFGPSKHKQGTVVKVDRITANKNVSNTNLGWKRKPVNLSKVLGSMYSQASIIVVRAFTIQESSYTWLWKTTWDPLNNTKSFYYLQRYPRNYLALITNFKNVTNLQIQTEAL